MFRSAVLAAVALLACSAHVRAQGIDLSGGGPVDVTAQGGFEWRENEQKVIATGDARAVRGNVTVISDRLIAYYRKKAGSAAAPAAPAPPPASAKPGTPGETDEGSNEVYRLEAEGHVQIFTPTDHAVADRAIYDIDQAVLVMTGHDMKLTTAQDVMTSRDTMEYWSQKHMAIGRGNATVVTNDGRRISGDTLVGYTADPNASPEPKPVPAPVVAGKAGDPMGASGKLKRVEAYGNVEVRTAVDIVRGDRGLYLPETGIARIVGHVRITHGQNQVNGPAADVNMKTGIAHIVSSSSQRVTGLIVPNDQSLQQNKPGTAANAGSPPAVVPSGTEAKPGAEVKH